jgi:hypothetical protein
VQQYFCAAAKENGFLCRKNGVTAWRRRRSVLFAVPYALFILLLQFVSV